MRIATVLGLILLMYACVPAKKYQELLEKSNACDTELSAMKEKYLTYDAQNKELQAKVEQLDRSVNTLKSDTTRLGNSMRQLRAKYDQLAR